MVVLSFYVLVFNFFVCCWRLMYVFMFLVKFRYFEWPPVGKIAAHSAYDMFSWYKYLGLVTRRHRKFPFLRHTYDDLKMTALEFMPLLFYRIFSNERRHFVR